MEKVIDVVQSENTDRDAATKSRRKFVLTSLAAGVVLTVAASTSVISKILRGFFPSLMGFGSKESFKAGKPRDYKVGVVDGRWMMSHRLWMVRNLDGIYALRAVCPHASCGVEWSEKDQQFHASCGSKFYKSGINFEGLAKRPLERVAVRLSEGEILVDPASLFFHEKGGWNHPGSLLAI